MVRVLLRPFEAALAAVDAQRQPVLIADGDLTGPQHALCAALPFDKGLNVVIEAPSLDEGRELREQFVSTSRQSV